MNNHIYGGGRISKNSCSVKRESVGFNEARKKGFATTGVLDENIETYLIDGRTFYVVMSNVFKHLLETFYVQAMKKFPEKFGTGNANDVIAALHAVRPMFFDIPQYIELLRNEQFTYLFEYEGNQFSDRVLRIDLFRKLEENEKGQFQFTGGIMHAFKHFSINGINLTTGKDINEIARPLKVILHVINAFFLKQGKFEKSDTLISYVPIAEKRALKFAFYLEEVTRTYFIKTIHKNKWPVKGFA